MVVSNAHAKVVKSKVDPKNYHRDYENPKIKKYDERTWDELKQYNKKVDRKTWEEYKKKQAAMEQLMEVEEEPSNNAPSPSAPNPRIKKRKRTETSGGSSSSSSSKKVKATDGSSA